MWICIPKAIWSDTIFEPFLKQMKKNKIPVKVKVVGEGEQERITGPALIVTLLKEHKEVKKSHLLGKPLREHLYLNSINCIIFAQTFSQIILYNYFLNLT